LVENWKNEDISSNKIEEGIIHLKKAYDLCRERH